MSHAKFYVSSSDAIDLHLVQFYEPMFLDKPTIYPEEPRIPDEVMALGYPNISGFVPALLGRRRLHTYRRSLSGSASRHCDYHNWVGNDHGGHARGMAAITS
jgi:hypothetical protein